jgi:hypothetical protein
VISSRPRAEQQGGSPLQVASDRADLPYVTPSSKPKGKCLPASRAKAGPALPAADRLNWPQVAVRNPNAVSAAIRSLPEGGA